MTDRKRVFDLAVCVVAAPVVAPIGAVIALALRLTAGPPVLYRSRRVGRHRREFDMLKFRTMDARGSGPAVTASGDPRITTIGRWLRRTKLDELPQLVNVVRGDMAIVGPRPEAPKYVNAHARYYEEILTLAPGVTGPAALAFRHEEALLAERMSETGDDLDTVYQRDILPHKIAFDLEYVRNHRLRSDITLILSTGLAVLGRGRSADTAKEGADAAH
jgi:lipopolysaccharide/colanic/teichoic acid biosynthesis glycosyltransferase